jgi:lipoate-protein ligase A
MKEHGKIYVVELDAAEGWRNMALDFHLFSLCEKGEAGPFLRFYTWQPPALSLGFHEPAGIIDAACLVENGIDVIRRPTGGRVVLHKNDLTYAVVLPAGAGGPAAGGIAETYRLISECIVDGLRMLGGLSIERGKPHAGPAGARPCFASTSRYEVTHEGRKVVGSAQRIGRRSLLQHGSIPVGRDYLEVARYLKGVDGAALQARLEATTTCLEEVAGKSVDICEITQSLTASFARGLGLEPVVFGLDEVAPEVSRLTDALRRCEYAVSYEVKTT